MVYSVGTGLQTPFRVPPAGLADGLGAGSLPPEASGYTPTDWFPRRADGPRVRLCSCVRAIKPTMALFVCMGHSAFAVNPNAGEEARGG